MMNCVYISGPKFDPVVKAFAQHCYALAMHFFKEDLFVLTGDFTNVFTKSLFRVSLILFCILFGCLKIGIEVANLVWTTQKIRQNGADLRASIEKCAKLRQPIKIQVSSFYFIFILFFFQS